MMIPAIPPDFDSGTIPPKPFPLFSIIMPSFLGDYQNAATDRIRKFHRAIQSVLNQYYPNFELVVVSDGCEITRRIMEDYQEAKFIFIAKQAYLSGEPRNTGIKNASGKYIGYADTDDALGKDHLGILADQIKDDEWYFFNDWTADAHGNFYQRWCSPSMKGQCGTSNIIHKRQGSPSWGAGYEHDWDFIQLLGRKSPPVFLLKSPKYYVCHIPKLLDI